MRIVTSDAQLHETTRVEEVEARRCKARLKHLVAVGLPQKDEATKWTDARMDRILADHMLRRGYQRSAAQLARERDMEVRSLHLSAVLQLHYCALAHIFSTCMWDGCSKLLPCVGSSPLPALCSSQSSR